MKKFCIFNEIEKSQKENSKYIEKKKIYPYPKEMDEYTAYGYGYYSKEKNDKNKSKYRYLLEIYLGEKESSNSILNVIMFNPSEYGKERENLFMDKTITNVVKIANDNGYNHINILNLFSEIQSKSQEVNISYEEDILYLIDYIDKKNNDVLLAWGTIRDNKLIKSIKKDICDKLLKKHINIYTFCANKNRMYPKHPANIDIDCCRNCFERKGSITLENFETRASKYYEN